MRAPLATLHRVYRMRLVREERRVKAAADALALAEQDLALARTRLAAAEARQARAAADLLDQPQCEQRRFLRAHASERLSDARQAHGTAQIERDDAHEKLLEARKAEMRAEMRRDVVGERLTADVRQTRERIAEQEGEERWTTALIA